MVHVRVSAPCALPTRLGVKPVCNLKPFKNPEPLNSNQPTQLFIC